MLPDQDKRSPVVGVGIVNGQVVCFIPALGVHQVELGEAQGTNLFTKEGPR